MIHLAQMFMACALMHNHMYPDKPCLDDAGAQTTIMDYDRARYQALPVKPAIDPHPEIPKPRVIPDAPGAALEQSHGVPPAQ